MSYFFKPTLVLKHGFVALAVLKWLVLEEFCNGLNPLLVDIVLFGLFLSGYSSRFLKRVCYGEDFTCSSFFSPIDMGSHKFRVFV